MTLRVAWDMGPELEAERILDQRWNGWAVPVMTRPQVEALIAASAALAAAAPDDAEQLAMVGEIFVIDAPESAKEHADIEPSQIHPEADGLYVIDLGWTFVVVEQPLTIVLTEEERCPACGDTDLSLWAEDGESPRADLYECAACGQHGDVVQPPGASNAEINASEMEARIRQAINPHGHAKDPYGHLVPRIMSVLSGTPAEALAAGTAVWIEGNGIAADGTVIENGARIRLRLAGGTEIAVKRR